MAAVGPDGGREALSCHGLDSKPITSIKGIHGTTLPCRISHLGDEHRLSLIRAVCNGEIAQMKFASFQ